MCFILINSCIIFQINFLKNLILIRIKGIEANYLYVHQTNFTLKINHMNCFLHQVHQLDFIDNAAVVLP
jgi:hypothetical protein